MKFCKTCKALFLDTDELCPTCKKKLKSITDINEPVRLAVVGGTERALLTGMLKDAGIPYLEENVSPRGVNNDIITGYDVKLSNIAVLVPYSAIPKASELLSSIETLENHVEAFLPAIENDIEKKKENSLKEEKPLNPALRTTIKVVTAILFFILVAVVVFGTDKIMEFIMGFFK